MNRNANQLWDAAQKRRRIQPFRDLVSDTRTIYRCFIKGQDGLDAHVREQGIKHLRASRELRFGRNENDPQP